MNITEEQLKRANRLQEWASQLQDQAEALDLQHTQNKELAAQLRDVLARNQEVAKALKQLYADRRRDGDRLLRALVLSLVGTVMLLALGESFQNVLLMHGALSLAFIICATTWKAAELFVKRVLLKGKDS